MRSGGPQKPTTRIGRALDLAEIYQLLSLRVKYMECDSMSFQAMAWAVKQKLPSREKLLLLMVANYADESGKCWPSNGRLIEDTGLSKSTIILAFKDLEAAGLLIIKRRSVDGVSLSNMYCLNLTGGGLADELPGQDEDGGGVGAGRGVVRQPDGGGPGAGPKPINEPINRNLSKESSARGFDKFWLAYPRKTAKGAAEKAWEKAARLEDPEKIIDAVGRASWPNDPQFIPHASTWLNQKRWLDENTRVLTLAEQYALKAVLAAEEEADIDGDLLIYRGE